MMYKVLIRMSILLKDYAEKIKLTDLIHLYHWIPYTQV